MGEIIGENYWGIYCAQPSSYEQKFGNFNNILENKILVFADELVWGGCKSNAGTLKKYITEPHLYSNEKNMSIRKLTNESNWLIASNEDWVVPAGSKERRYIVLNMKNDMLYYSTTQKTRLWNVCPFSLASYLYNIDLTNWDNVEIIDTPGMIHQKMLSFDSISNFWLDFISERKLDSENLYINADFLYNLYYEFCEKTKEKRPAGKIAFYKKTKDLLDVGKKQFRNNGEREYGFDLISHEHIREKFNEYMGSECIS